MKQPARSLFLALLLAGLAACGDPGRDEHGASEANAGPPAVRARVAEAKRVTVPIEIDLQGLVEAERTAAVSTRVMATVTAVEVNTGDRVVRGQTLLRLDPEAAQGQVAQARGALAQARAGLALAERNFQRYQALAARDAASELEVDQARTQYEQARGAVEQGDGAVAAAVSVAADSRVIAPFDGRVVQRLVEVGDLAAPGRPLLLLESAGRRRLALALPESLVTVAGIALGSAVAVTVDARPDLGRLTGTVVETTPGADPQSHAFAVKVALPDLDLPTGIAARATLTTGRRDAITVPAAALLRHGGLELVILEVDGRTSSRAVTSGRTRDDEVEILSGLAGGERLLVGLGALPPAGSPVEELP